MKLYNIQVSAYAGYKANERPLDFTFKKKKHLIKNIIQQTYEKNVSGGLIRRFTVKTDEGIIFKLCYNEKQDQWFIED
ncbi:MAG: putative cytosolic protein [Candidatus Scalindua rubra]|uniref:Putative cytosolic protein n=1 Tax=Candidatus Scalindua rubra TaxID=1872076 RepID=A0A1E3X5F9_9BACT|nr:MAG: putative cytosolic protein [Candidatus Scalindua rubra]